MLHAAAIGAGAAVAGAALGNAALPAIAAASLPPVFTGDVTLGAHLITFVGAPISNEGSTSWSVTTERTDTLKFGANADQTLSMSFDQSATGSRFGTTSGSGFKQTTAISIATAVTIRNTDSVTLISRAPVGGDGYARPGDTTFYLYARPKLNLTGNPGSGFKFKFLNSGFVLIANLNQLLSDPNTRNTIGALTADNIAAQYPFREGNTSGVGLPNKYKLKKTISAGPSTSPYQFVNSIASSSTVSVGLSETFSVEITESVGFNNGADPATSIRLQQTFAVGQSFSITINAMEERTNVTILTTGGELYNDRPRRLNNLYKVKPWKTFIMSDEGVIGGTSQLVAQGRITDSSGSPMGGMVGLLNGDKSIEAVADPVTGNYSLYSPTALPAGTYPVLCGDAQLTISRGGTANLRPTFGTSMRPINPIETV